MSYMATDEHLLYNIFYIGPDGLIRRVSYLNLDDAEQALRELSEADHKITQTYTTTSTRPEEKHEWYPKFLTVSDCTPNFGKSQD